MEGQWVTLVAWLQFFGTHQLALSYSHTSRGVRHNSLPPGQNGRHFTDDIFRCIFVNKKFCILIKISLNFVPKRPIDNKCVTFVAWLQFFGTHQLALLYSHTSSGGWHNINSLAPRRFEINFKEVIFKLILVIDGWGISCEIVLTWTPQDLLLMRSQHWFR